MPVGIIPNEGKNDLLWYQIGASISGVNPWSLRLFVNAITPDKNTVLADLTECALSGYSPIVMTRSGWTTPVLTADHADSTWGTTPQIFIFTSGSATIYGAYYTDDDLGVLRFVQLFDTPYSVVAGGVLSILPDFKYTSEF